MKCTSDLLAFHPRSRDPGGREEDTKLTFHQNTHAFTDIAHLWTWTHIRQKALDKCITLQKQTWKIRKYFTSGDVDLQGSSTWPISQFSNWPIICYDKNIRVILHSLEAHMEAHGTCGPIVHQCLTEVSVQTGNLKYVCNKNQKRLYCGGANCSSSNALCCLSSNLTTKRGTFFIKNIHSGWKTIHIHPVIIIHWYWFDMWQFLRHWLIDRI